MAEFAKIMIYAIVLFMNRLAGMYTLSALIVVLLLPQTSFAEDTTVKSQSEGQTTTCVNGQCTTTGGGNKTTICHNGQCSTVNNGNVDYESSDGHTQIHVHNNTANNSVNESSVPTTSFSDTPEPTVTGVPSISPDPTIIQMRKDLNNQVKKEIEGVKEHMKDENSALSDFFKAEMETLKNLLNSLFK